MAHRRPTGLILPPSIPVTNANDPINRGLVGAWMMDEGAGQVCRDWSGRNNNGIITQNTQGSTWVPGRSGKAVRFTFNGIATQAMTASNTTLAGLPSATLSMWAYQPTTGGTEVWASTDLAYNAGSWLFGTNGTSGLVYSPDGSPTSFTFPFNSWFHCVWQFTASTFQIFVNGQPAMAATATGQVTLGAISQLVLGNYAGSSPTTGVIQNFRAWSRALSKAEITRLYSQPFAGIVPPPKFSVRAAASSGNFTGSLADTVSTSDAYTGTGFSTSLADSVATSDALSLIASARLLADTVATSDAYNVSALAMADTVATSDSYVGTAFSTSLSDTVATSTSFTTTGPAASLSDTVTTATAFTPATFAPTASLSDTTATSDVFGIAGLALTDTVATSDALTVIAATRTLADTVATSDALAVIASSQTLADTVATSDTFALAGSLQALTDTIATSDIYVPGGFTAAGALTNTTASSDLYTPAMAASGALSDTTATSDAYTPGGAFAGVLADSLATSDAYNLTGSAKALSDTTATSDAYTAPSGQQVLADTVGTSDLYTSGAQYSASLSDTVSTSDVYGKIFLPLGPIIYGRPSYRFSYPTNNPPKV